MKKILMWALIAIVVIGVIIAITRDSSKSVSTSEPIVIGADFSLTSFGSSWGEMNLKGASLAVKEINEKGGVLGRRLELISEDNHSQGKDSVSAVNKLISVNKAQFLLTGWSDQTEPVIPIIDQNKIPTVTVSAGAVGITKKSKYLIRTWPSDVIAVKALVDYSIEKGFKRVALANSIGSWENTLVDSFKQYASQRGITIIATQSFSIDTQDFKTIAANLKLNKPDAIFIAITEGPVERFLIQTGQLGLNLPMLYPVDVTTLGVNEKVSVSYLKNLVYATYAPSKQVFVDAFKKAYDVLPGVSADTAYDAVYVLAHTITKAGTTEADKVVASLVSFDGASGNIVFDVDRDRSGAEVILMGFDGINKIPKTIN